MGILGDKIAELGANLLMATASKGISSYGEAVKSTPVQKLGQMFSELPVSTASAVGAVLGAPLGLFPMLYDIYSAGEGQLMRYEGAKIKEPYRLTPEVAVRLWRRNYPMPEFSEKWFEDAKDIGVSDERIEALKEATRVMPTPADIINFLAHEVFEKDMIAKYGLESEWDKIDKTFAKTIGLDEDILKLYWINHWIHPSLGSVYTMLHRDQITEKDMFEYYKLVEIPEFWRDKLTELSWSTPNRIETRMMTRYLDLPKVEVMDLLKKAGLKEEYRSDGADFMMVMGLQGYWSAMYRNNWLTKEELSAEIEAKELSPVIADRVYKYIIKAEKPHQIEEHRKLTRSLIIKGVKEGVVPPSQGIDLLMSEQNYDEDTAQYIMAVELAGMGSPETPLEFRVLVELDRKAMGRSFKEIPQDALDAEKAYYQAKTKLEGAVKTKAKQGIIDGLETDVVKLKQKCEDLLALYELSAK